MKKYSLIFAFAGMVLLAISTGCESEDPTLANVSLNMTATSANSEIAPNGRVSTTSTIVYSEFLIGVTEIEFETVEEDEAEEDENGNEIETEEEDIEFEGVFVVDVLNGTSNPDFGIADLAPGVYSEIEMEMEPVLENEQTISIKATFTVDNVDYPVEFTSNDDFELEIEREEGFSLTEGELSQILIVIDLDALFNNVDLSTASVDADGVIRINENSNTSLSEIIENNLENALEAGEDDDDDNEIDD
ncbi:MAG: hypothetical protein ACNS60_09205 [Candidatus Cyclobacteriaceae bacterium M2_1C_046]